MLVKERFGTDEQFLSRVTPDTQVSFAEKPESAIMGDYPTLRDLNTAYGRGFATEWLIPQLDNLSLYTGAKNITEQQQLELARIIATEYRHLKITELLLFFYKFKTGRYGRFYGSADPMVITCALREFITERNNIIEQVEQQEREKRDAEYKKTAITREEWLKMKEQNKEQI